MLPAWAAVAIALGGTAIGAAGAVIGSYLALRSVRLTHRHEVRQAWRTKMMEAAEDFVVASNALAWSVRPHLLDAADGRAVVDEQKLDEKWGELRRAGIRVCLVFGVDSRTCETAYALVELLREGIAAVTAGEPDYSYDDPRFGAIFRFLEEEDTRYDSFLDAAHVALAPSDSD